MKTVAYLRVSTGGQDVATQKLAVLDYARKNRLTVSKFVQTKLSSRGSEQKQQVLKIIEGLEKGDRLIVSELSRLGRSLGQIIHLVDTLIARKIRFVAIKEAIRFEGRQDMQTKVMIALFGLFAEIERDLISERTKEGLAAARKKGSLLGRPKGTLGKSKLDGKENEIKVLLGKRVSKASIAKILDVSPNALNHFIKTRELHLKKRRCS